MVTHSCPFKCFVALVAGYLIVLSSNTWADQMDGENWNDPGVTVIEPNVWGHPGVIVTTPNGDSSSAFPDNTSSCAITKQCDSNGYCVQHQQCY